MTDKIRSERYFFYIKSIHKNLLTRKSTAMRICLSVLPFKKHEMNLFSRNYSHLTRAIPFFLEE